MTTIHVPDGAGHSVELIDVDGCRTCTFEHSAEEQAQIVRGVKGFKCRADDIFICAPVKSGTHWLWEIVSMLIRRKAETIQEDKVFSMLEATFSEEIDAIPSPRVLNSHLHFNLLPEEAVEKGCKFFFILRNPKDLAVSFWHHVRGIQLYNYDGEFNQFLPMFLQGKLEYGCWFKYVREWEEAFVDHPHLPVHRLFYEDLKDDPVAEIRKVANYLGIQDEDLIHAVYDKSHFSKMAVDKANIVDDAANKHSFSVFRKGQIGDWKNYFTVAQNKIFDSVYAEKMKDSKIKFRYTSKH